MALSLGDLKAHCAVTGSDDDALLTRLLAAATKQVERNLGFQLSDSEKLPGGAPADLEHAVYMLAAHFYENREASLIGVAAQILPLGVSEIIAEYRDYTFGLCDEAEAEDDE
jgi:uncharacterized phage protein (predicted DNA packaging)